MSAPLGPCPACGGKEDGQGWCIGRRLFIQCASCDFSCVEAHWNTMHRKMMREEAENLVNHAWDEWDKGNCKDWHESHAAVYAALAGEKT